MATSSFTLSLLFLLLLSLPTPSLQQIPYHPVAATKSFQVPDDVAYPPLDFDLDVNHAPLQPQGGKVTEPSLLKCSPFHCFVKMQYGDRNVTLPCSVASGPFPITPTLPLYFQGNYDLCATFEKAHFCSIKTQPLIVPLSKETFVMLGQFRLDQCVSKACDSAALRASFEQTLNITVKTIIKMLPVPKDGKKVAKALLRLFETSTQIACVGEASHSLGFPGVLCLCVLCLMVGLVVVFTVYDVYCRGPSFARIGDEALAHVQQGEAGNAPQNGMPSQPSSNVERVTRWFSASHNVDRLMSVIGGDFKALNGIRVLSMCWIIMGHTILMFVMPPVVNPTVEDRFLRSVPFAFVRGAEYSVDTFFFMSGFLATFALMNQLKLKGILSASQYVSMVFLRYLRLTPSYAVVLLFFWKVLPLVSSGPFWDETTIFSSDACDKHWWTNLLYVNNLVPFNATAQEMCMGWSWYLANDFQFFLLLPIIVSLHLVGRSRGSRMLMWGPCLFFITVQLVAVPTTLYSKNMYGNQFIEPQYWQFIYAAPWTRCTPYMLGAMLSMYYNHRDGPSALERKLMNAAFVLALGAMLALVLGHADQWVCKESKAQCEAFGTSFSSGYFALKNWSQDHSIWYLTFAWVIWSCGLAVVCYAFFAGYDLFKVHWFLSHQAFTPLARLTYNAYLVHLILMSIVHGSRSSLPFFGGLNIFMEVVFFIVAAYATSFALYIFIEKPCMNMVSDLITVRRVRKGSATRGGHVERFQRLQRNMSSLSDVDSETMAIMQHEHNEQENGDDYRPLQSN